MGSCRHHHHHHLHSHCHYDHKQNLLGWYQPLESNWKFDSTFIWGAISFFFAALFSVCVSGGYGNAPLIE